MKTKVLQFGEGNFLRAFVDWIINSMNKAKVFDGGVVLVQPMPFGRVKELNDEGVPIDITIVSDRLENNKNLTDNENNKIPCNLPFEHRGSSNGILLRNKCNDAY